MPTDPEIWESAQRMVERYGSNALIQIKSRIDELGLLGETEAREVWVRILDAAKHLLEDKNPNIKH